jgi:hypothetical protein
MWHKYNNINNAINIRNNTSFHLMNASLIPTNYYFNKKETVY